MIPEGSNLCEKQHASITINVLALLKRRKTQTMLLIEGTTDVLHIQSANWIISFRKVVYVYGQS